MNMFIYYYFLTNLSNNRNKRLLFILCFLKYTPTYHKNSRELFAWFIIKSTDLIIVFAQSSLYVYSKYKHNNLITLYWPDNIICPRIQRVTVSRSVTYSFISHHWRQPLYPISDPSSPVRIKSTMYHVERVTPANNRRWHDIGSIVGRWPSIEPMLANKYTTLLPVW